jgi:hypothetical protein
MEVVGRAQVGLQQSGEQQEGEVGQEPARRLARFGKQQRSQRADEGPEDHGAAVRVSAQDQLQQEGQQQDQHELARAVRPVVPGKDE